MVKYSFILVPIGLTVSYAGIGFYKLISLIIIFFGLRFVYLVWRIKSHQKDEVSLLKIPVKCAVVIGSGGHTSEMLKIVSALNPTRYERYYILADSDTTSLSKISEMEKTHNLPEGKRMKIPRSRKVHQSYFSSIFTTLFSIFYCVPLMLRLSPDLVLCNGPGTCIPICGLAFLLKTFYIKNPKIIFIESICRVKSLSLSGKILLYLADEMLVQWPDLMELYPRVKYVGRL